jgi:hypothetical protein
MKTKKALDYARQGRLDLAVQVRSERVCIYLINKYGHRSYMCPIRYAWRLRRILRGG